MAGKWYPYVIVGLNLAALASLVVCLLVGPDNFPTASIFGLYVIVNLGMALYESDTPLLAGLYVLMGLGVPFFGLLVLFLLAFYFLPEPVPR